MARAKSGKATDEDFTGRIPKPGLESSVMHISQLFLKHHPEVAREVTRRLRPHLAARLGVRR